MSTKNASWKTSASGIEGHGAPIPINIVIPEAFSESVPGMTLLNPSTVRIAFNPPLIIPDNCCADLVTAAFPYSQPNVAGAGVMPAFPTGNNRISVNWGGGGWTDWTIPQGLYSYFDVMIALNNLAYDKGYTTNPADQLFILIGISSTQGIQLELNPAVLTGGVFPAGNVVLSFQNPSPATGHNDSMGNLLGFGVGATTYTALAGSSAVATWVSPDAADFAAISAYVLYASLVTSSYQNGLTGSLLYSFPLGVSPPNSIVSWQSSLRYPVPVTANSYSSLDIWTTDQSGNRLPWSLYQAPFSFSFVVSKNRHDGSL